MINWIDPKSNITTHFTVNDCLYLPKWTRLANEADGLTEDVKHNLINLCAKMEAVRVFLKNKPINVHCMFRPALYNKLVNGSKSSQHLYGNAIDFDVGGAVNEMCDHTRLLLEPKLEEFEIRMEDTSDKPQRNWVHIDVGPVIHNRYFKP